MTLFRLLISVSGFSHTQAADFLDVRRDTINSWSASRNPTPSGVITELATLISRMQNAVDQTMETIDEQHTEPAIIELGYCADDHEAQSLGWPTASVHARVIGMIASQCIELGHTVEVLPRGTTIATAAAIQSHNK